MAQTQTWRVDSPVVKFLAPAWIVVIVAVLVLLFGSIAAGSDVSWLSVVGILLGLPAATAQAGPGRVADESTVRRVFGRVDADVLAAVIGAWLYTRTGVFAGRRVIAIDGKTLRGARTRDRVLRTWSLPSITAPAPSWASSR